MTRHPPWCRPPAEGHVHRVLVVDDSAAIRTLVSDVLEAEGYSTLGSPDGAAALRQAWVEPPCLALVDIRMPVMDGPAFVRACRRDKNLRDLPIVFLSGYREEEVTAGLSVDGFIPKPFHLHQLLDGVATIVGTTSNERVSPAVAAM